MRTFDLWHLDLVENNIPVLHSLSPERVPKIHKIVDFWWSIPHWENRICHFVARLIATSCSVSVLMIWGCWGHWGHWGRWGCWGHWGCWGSWWQGNHPVTKVQAAFDFLRPKRLLRSLRPVMLSCLLRSLRPLRCSKSLKSISSWLKSPYFDVLKKKYFWTEWWNLKWNSAIIQDWGCGGQGCYFQQNPRVISQNSASHECTNTVFMT